MRRALLCFGLLFIGFPTFAQAPGPPAPSPTPAPAPTMALSLAASGPVSIQEGTSTTFALIGGSVTSVAWLVIPPAPTTQAGQSLTILSTATAQTYTVIAFAVSGGQPVIVQSPLTIAASEMPEPKAIVIFDPTTLTSLPAGQVAILQSRTIIQGLASAGIAYEQFSSMAVIKVKGSTAPILSTTWGSAASQAGLPALVLVSGGAVTGQPLPQTQAALVQAAGVLNRKR